MRIATAADLERLRAEGLSTLYPDRLKISVGMATCGLAAGAAAVYDALRDETTARGLDLALVTTGCLGYCQQEPLADVRVPGRGRLLYSRVTPERARALVAALADGIWPPDGALAATSFFARQHKIVLRNCGLIDPTRPEEYVARDGYRGLARALSDLSPQAVVDEVTRSGLRGRGGAGFPTGRKWQVARAATGEPKYVICNADEGDPGAYMDRTVLESDPFSVVEGLTIAGYAVGARQGFIYVREEYPLAYERVSEAVARARELGLLGENILGSGLAFDVAIVRGAGAFVCGEETALISSIEGGLGEPRPRPPYPATSGLWGRPTVINNVKTLAAVPVILAQGADPQGAFGSWYAAIGAEGNAGTAVFSLVGKVTNTGLAEVPLGMPLGELIEEVGGGGARGRRVKAVQTGGPSGGCLPRSLWNLPITYEKMAEAGSIMGSGGMVVLDEETCMVDVARFFLGFTMDESCGKCTFCREGTRHLHDILSCIAAGQGRLEDLVLLEEVAQGVKAGSLCGLGQTAPNPVLSTLRYFRDEYVAHIVNKRCPAGVCKPLVRARCVNGCPAEVDIPSWLALVAQGRYVEAIEVHRRTNPFVLICSRVCPAFCESRCRRGELDQPAAIRQVKRFMADHELAHPWTPPKLEEPKAERVAVIGGGPAGLTTALRLAQQGYGVTIFEKLPILGGMMAVGIPAYRLPRELLEFEIAGILRAGIEVKTEMALGRDFTLDSLFADDYRAIILAIGAHRSRPLGIPGEDKPGVMAGVDFLREVALQRVLGIGYSQYPISNQRVGVIGGGDVAIDAARTAWRLGAREVHLIYRRDRDQMPAYPDQVRVAEEEGVIFHFLTAPVQVLGDGRVTGLECQRQALGEFDSDGRRRPVPKAETFTLPLDVLIAAIGQETGLAGEDGLARYPDGTIVVNEAMATSREGVFAAGDALTGPATVVNAVAQGNEVARCVDRYLRTGQTEQLVTLPGYEVVEQAFDLAQYAAAGRPPIPTLPIEQRRGSFAEVEQGWDESTTREECKRCLRCDLEWLLEMGLPQESRPEQAVVPGKRSATIDALLREWLDRQRREQLRQEIIESGRAMADVYLAVEREYHPLEEEVHRGLDAQPQPG
jgi:NADH-quinone oxidoreductase subunit F